MCSLVGDKMREHSNYQIGKGIMVLLRWTQLAAGACFEIGKTEQNAARVIRDRKI